MALSETGEKLKKRLVSMRNEKDFWGGVLSILNTDKGRQRLIEMLDYAEEIHHELSVSEIIAMALNIRDEL